MHAKALPCRPLRAQRKLKGQGGSLQGGHELLHVVIELRPAADMGGVQQAWAHDSMLQAGYPNAC